MLSVRDHKSLFVCYILHAIEHCCKSSTPNRLNKKNVSINVSELFPSPGIKSIYAILVYMSDFHITHPYILIWAPNNSSVHHLPRGIFFVPVNGSSSQNLIANRRVEFDGE